MPELTFNAIDILVFLCSYLVGALPTAFIITKVLTGKDIREHGSGNAGGTNVMRVVGKIPGVVVILLDVFKGGIVVFFVMKLTNNPHIAILSGFTAVIGHIWPVYTRFKGGKGVATTFGLFFIIEPVSALISLGLLIGILLISKMMSLASILSLLSFNLIFIINDRVDYSVLGPLKKELVIYFFILTLVVLLKHSSNIKRIIQGNENKLNLWKKKEI